MSSDFTSRVDDVHAHVLSKQGAGAVEVALFEDNLWWTPEQVAGLVGQRITLTDTFTQTRGPARITKAWKRDGMICARIETTGDDDKDDE